MTVVDFVRLLRHGWKTLVVTGLLGLLTAGAFIMTRPVFFQASTIGMVVAGDAQMTGSVMAGNLLAEQRAEAYLALIDTRAVANLTAEELKAKKRPRAASGSVRAEIVPNTTFIRVTATGTTAADAQALANASLNALAEEALNLETYGQTQGRTVSHAEKVRLSSVHVLPYEPASLPAAPARQNLPQGLAAGLLGGLVLGGFIIAARKQLDVRVRTQKDLEGATGRSVLGVVPDTRDLKNQRKKRDMRSMGQAGEALRQLRTNLRFVQVDQPPKAVVITSATAGEGKSTLATNLAQLIARSGRDVVLVDCDLRKPMQAQAFGVDAQIGLTQVLAGDVSLRGALMPTQVPRLKLLPAGRIPPNPSELLGSQRMHDVIKDLSRDAFVILDAPPMLVVTDAGLLSVAADGAILVVNAGRTPKDAVSLCTKQLEMLGATLLGSVLNKAKRENLGEYGYAYGYGYRKYKDAAANAEFELDESSAPIQPEAMSSARSQEVKPKARRVAPGWRPREHGQSGVSGQ